MRYGDDVGRCPRVAVDEVLAAVGAEEARYRVESAVDVERADRLTDGTPFVLAVPLADGTLETTEWTVVSDRR